MSASTSEADADRPQHDEEDLLSDDDVGGLFGSGSEDADPT